MEGVELKYSYAQKIVCVYNQYRMIQKFGAKYLNIA